MNIEFAYRYRDAGNYKQRHSVIFSNPTSMTVEQAKERIEGMLIDRMYFFADVAKLPEMFIDPYDKYPEIEWHEFDEITLTEESVNDKQERTFEAFLADLEKASQVSCFRCCRRSAMEW